MGTAEESSAVKATLLIQNGDFSGTSYSLAGNDILIGRTPTTEITLLDDGISREHALIAYDAARKCYVIEDLQSTNGTCVNGKRIRSRALEDGDEIQIGRTVFKFCYEGTAGSNS